MYIKNIYESYVANCPYERNTIDNLEKQTIRKRQRTERQTYTKEKVCNIVQPKAKQIICIKKVLGHIKIIKKPQRSEQVTENAYFSQNVPNCGCVWPQR